MMVEWGREGRGGGREGRGGGGGRGGRGGRGGGIFSGRHLCRAKALDRARTAAEGGSPSLRRCKTSSSSCEGTLSITSKAALARDTAEQAEDNLQLKWGWKLEPPSPSLTTVCCTSMPATHASVTPSSQTRAPPLWPGNTCSTGEQSACAHAGPQRCKTDLS